MNTPLTEKNNFWRRMEFKVTGSLIASFVFSFIFIWVVSYFFLDSLITFDYDRELNKYTVTPGITYTHKSEGGGMSHYGKYNISAIADVTKIPYAKVAIWGDSYVEGFQVDDQAKLAQVATALSDSDGPERLLFMGIGLSGDDVADYYFNIPRYEKIIPSIVAHFILITNLRDTLPDIDLNRGVFKSAPYRLVENQWKPAHQEFKKMLDKYKLSFMWMLIKSISTLELRFTPGTAPAAQFSEESDQTYNHANEAWAFLLAKLKKQTDLPIIFIYCPMVPRIAHGEILFSDRNADDVREFSRECLKQGIGFINTREDFIEFYRTTGQFPRGFPNSRPGRGHFNENGHRIHYFNFYHDLRLVCIKKEQYAKTDSFNRQLLFLWLLGLSLFSTDPDSDCFRF